MLLGPAFIWLPVQFALYLYPLLDATSHLCKYNIAAECWFTCTFVFISSFLYFILLKAFWKIKIWVRMTGGPEIPHLFLQ